MNDSSGIRKVDFRRNFQNLPKQGKKKKKKEEKDEEKQEEEIQRKPPPSPDGTSSIDLTA